MGLIFRTAIIVGTMTVMSPVHQRDLPTAQGKPAPGLTATGQDLARRAGEEASRHVTPALAIALWTAIEPADRQALARAVLDALVDDPAPSTAKPLHVPRG
jgi:hypothetical protein